jgi:hypothetical protein
MLAPPTLPSVTSSNESHADLAADADVGCDHRDMQARIVAVYPGVPTAVDTVVVAGVCVRAEWVGVPPALANSSTWSLTSTKFLRRADAIAVDGAEQTLREGTLLRGTVETQDREILTVRIARWASAD